MALKERKGEGLHMLIKDISNVFNDEIALAKVHKAAKDKDPHDDEGKIKQSRLILPGKDIVKYTLNEERYRPPPVALKPSIQTIAIEKYGQI